MTMTFTNHPRRFNSITAMALASTLGLVACDLGPKAIGNQPDSETGEDEGTDEGTEDTDDGVDVDEGTEDTGDEPGACGEKVESIITDLEVIPAGFESSVADLIAQADGNYEGSLTWNQNDGPVTVTFAGTSSPLAMAVAHLGGEVRFTEVEFAGEFPNGQEGGSPCSNHLEIDVQFNFVTEDGVLAESFVAPLDAYSHSEDPDPSFYLELDFDDPATHMGSASWDDFAFTDAEVEAIILDASFPGDAVDGSLNMQVLTMDWVGFGGIASFDAELVEGP